MGILQKLFGKKPKNTFKLSAEEIKPILVNQGGCFATNMITIDGCPVGYMYREQPDNKEDSGWRFFSGTESQEYVDDSTNTQIYDINTIANYDSDIVPYTDLPAGSELERIPNSKEFKLIQNQSS
ncbi:MAG: hypothetical protein ACJAZ2_001251 [Glaciecola sp.]|jgi:hypothetical protein